MPERLFEPVEWPVDDSAGPSVISRITEWLKSDVPSARPELLQETLERIGALFDVERALMVWEEADEPWINVANWERSGGLVWKQAAPASFDPLVVERLRSIPFWFSGDRDDVIHPALRSDYSVGAALSMPVDSEEIQGRFFALGLEKAEPVHFTLGELAASVVESRFRLFARANQPHVFATDDKVRMIARDLHDGLLQSFTGIVLQLESLMPLIESDPEEARRSITAIEAVLMNEQRELRSYLESLREKRKPTEADFDMTGRLLDLANRYQDQWGVEIEYRRDTLDPLIRQALGWETYRIITEAITNATRHGNAKHVRVTLSTEDDRLQIGVQDDGEGFPFRGRLTGPELIERGIGPGSLSERIHLLNGEIAIESSDEGSRLDISIPIGWKHS